MPDPNGDPQTTRTRLVHTTDPNRFGADPRVPLLNLSVVLTRIDSVRRFLSESINTNAVITSDHTNMVSNEIITAIHQIIVNGAALVSNSRNATAARMAAGASEPPDAVSPKNPSLEFSETEKGKQEVDETVGENEEDCEENNEIVELAAAELLAEPVHLCEICGDEFKRDVNLRMHMRAHGDEFKAPIALVKPKPYQNLNRVPRHGAAATRFSCPLEGCNRNKLDKKFKPLKSMICLKNHFKRKHCAKTYTCSRCRTKNFSVVSDLKSHMKLCGSEWRCSCGTTFSRKDKLYGHTALFGHVPALAADEEKEKWKQVAMEEEDHEHIMLMLENEVGTDYFLDDDWVTERVLWRL